MQSQPSKARELLLPANMNGVVHRFLLGNLYKIGMRTPVR